MNDTGRSPGLYWLVPVAFLIHDAEELATLPAWLADHRSELAALLARLGAGALAEALPSTFTRAALAIGCVLVGFVVVTAGVTLRPDSVSWRRLFAGLLGAFFLHAFTHVGQAIAFGGYTPGVVTAVVVVVPVSLFVYGRLLARGALDWGTAVVAGAIGMAAFVPIVIGALSVAAWLTS